MSHEPFFQNMILIFYMPIPYPFALKIKYYIPSQGNWSLFFYSPLTIWMNANILDFLYHELTSHVYNGMPCCSHRFVNFSFTYIFNHNFLFIWCLFVSKIWQCCITSSANLLASIYLLFDIKKNSKPNSFKLVWNRLWHMNKILTLKQLKWRIYHCGIYVAKKFNLSDAL